MIKDKKDYNLYEKFQNKSSLSHACLSNNHHLVKLLIENGADVNQVCDQSNFTPIHYAVERKCFKIAKLLLSLQNLRVDVRTTEEGFTPLNLACSIRKLRIEFVEMLIEKDGSQINVPCKNGRTPIFFACLHKRLYLANYLIKHGANLNHRDMDGRTSLHYAAIYLNYETFEFLLNEASIDPTIKDKYGEKALQLLLKNSLSSEKITRDLACKLIDKSFEIDPETQNYNFPDFFELSVLACSKSFYGDYFIPKFYSKNNSKYYLIARLEKHVFTKEIDPASRFFLYTFVHDLVSKENIEKLASSYVQMFNKSHYALIVNSVLSDELNASVLELFNYLKSIGFYDTSLKSYLLSQFSKKLGRTVLPLVAENLNSVASRKRLCNVIEFFSEIGVNISEILKNFFVKIKNLRYKNDPRVESWIEIVCILLPYSIKSLDGFELLEFSEKIGEILLPIIADNLTKPSVKERLSTILKILSQNGVSIDTILEMFLKVFLLQKHDQNELWIDTLHVLLEFTTDSFRIISKYLSPENSTRFMKNTFFREFYVNYLRRYCKLHPGSQSTSYFSTDTFCVGLS